MIRPATINAGNRPDASRPAVMPLGERHVPEWWVDERPERGRQVSEARATVDALGPGLPGYTAGYDVPQTMLDAETGMRQALHILRPYLIRTFR